MNLTTLSKYLPFVLTIAAFLLGVGDVPFTDAASFQEFVAQYFPQLGGLTVIGAGLWFVVNKLKDYINPTTIRNALADGKLDIGDVIGAVDDELGRDVGTYVKSALADGAFVTLFHACDFDAELTGKLNETHSLYRLKRAAPNNV